MKNFKSFINEAGPNAKPKAKGEADFVDAHKVEISDPEEQGTDGSAKVTTKEGSGKRKADRLDNKQAMGEDAGQADARKTTPSSKEAQQKVFDKHKERMKQLAKEEVEELDELKKSTLASYVKKRVKQLPKIEVGYQMAPSDRDARMVKKYQSKVNKGIVRAVDRLANEEVELDEVSLDTAKKAYQKRAQRAYDTEDDKEINKQSAQSGRIIKKFGKAGHKAVDSVHRKFDNYKEEVELDEEQLIEMDKSGAPFTPNKPKKNPPAKAGKYGQGPSTAKHLAQMALKKQLEKMKEEVEESIKPELEKHFPASGVRKHAPYTNPGLEKLAQQKKTLRTMKKSMKEADFSKQQTKMAHTIGKEFEKKGVGDQYKGGPYAVASAMVRDKPESAKKAYKTIQSKMKEEADTELLFKLYNDLNEENQEFFMHQLEEDAESLLDFAKMLEE